MNTIVISQTYSRNVIAVVFAVSPLSRLHLLPGLAPLDDVPLLGTDAQDLHPHGRRQLFLKEAGVMLIAGVSAVAVQKQRQGREGG